MTGVQESGRIKGVLRWIGTEKMVKDGGERVDRYKKDRRIWKQHKKKYGGRDFLRQKSDIKC